MRKKKYICQKANQAIMDVKGDIPSKCKIFVNVIQHFRVVGLCTDYSENSKFQLFLDL